KAARARVENKGERMSTHSIRAADVKPEPITWLWQRRIPLGMITLVAGRPGEGKSLFACYLAAAASNTGSVIYSTREDPLRQGTRPRLSAAGGKFERIHFFPPELPQDSESP